MSSKQTLEWTDADKLAVDVVRALAMDAVEAAGSGHPGTAMSLAPAAYLLFQRPDAPRPDRPGLARPRPVRAVLRPLQPDPLHPAVPVRLRPDRSRTSSHLRQWGSLTPGHPEHGHTLGVETTTGPLGQGVGNAVGMAMAARRERGLFDPDAAAGESPFDHTIWCFASDGDLEEGISAEASSIAGTQRARQPGRLI